VMMRNGIEVGVQYLSVMDVMGTVVVCDGGSCCLHPRVIFTVIFTVSLIRHHYVYVKYIHIHIYIYTYIYFVYIHTYIYICIHIYILHIQ